MCDAVRAVLGWARSEGPSVRDTQIGAVSFLHQFVSSVDAHFHYHVLVLDGAFSEGEDGGVRIHEASELIPEHWHRLQYTLQRRVLRCFRRRDLLDESTTGDLLTR